MRLRVRIALAAALASSLVIAAFACSSSSVSSDEQQDAAGDDASGDDAPGNDAAAGPDVVCVVETDGSDGFPFSCNCAANPISVSPKDTLITPAACAAASLEGGSAVCCQSADGVLCQCSTPYHVRCFRQPSAQDPTRDESCSCDIYVPTPQTGVEVASCDVARVLPPDGSLYDAGTCCQTGIPYVKTCQCYTGGCAGSDAVEVAGCAEATTPYKCGADHPVQSCAGVKP